MLVSAGVVAWRFAYVYCILLRVCAIGLSMSFLFLANGVVSPSSLHPLNTGELFQGEQLFGLP